MALILESLSVILATATIICGEEIKKSEKRGIADFGSGFSSSRLEGTGIKISTDFGKELTLEEFQRNGYNFGNENNANFAKANIALGDIKFADDSFDISKHLHFNTGQQFPSISQHNNIPESSLNYGFQNSQTIQGTQGNIENKVIQVGQSTTNNNQFGSYGVGAQGSQGYNNGETSSVSYLTQNIPIPVPHPYQVIVNRPEAVSVPQPYPVIINRPTSVPYYHPIPVPQKQEIQEQVPQQYHDSVAQSVPVNSPQTDTAQVSQPQFDVNVNANYQIQNYQAPAEQDHSGYEQRDSGNDLQKELNSASTASSGNHQFVPTNQISQPSLTNSQQVFHSNEQQYSIPQGVQLNENHAALSGQFSRVELQSGFLPSHYPTVDVNQGETTSEHQYPAATLPDQSQQSESHSAGGGQNQGLQTGHASSNDYQQNGQLIAGHPSLASHQQGLQYPGEHTFVTNSPQGTQSSEALHQGQPEASQQKVGKYSLLGGLFGHQALGHIQQILSRTGTLSGGHGHQAR